MIDRLNMEGERPRKTRRFDSDEEAEEFMLGFPNVNADVWIHILSSNPDLSVQDILRMRRINSAFKEMTDSNYIWNAIFIRQFGQKLFDVTRRILPITNVKNGAMYRLLAVRLTIKAQDVLVLQRGAYDNRDLRIGLRLTVDSNAHEYYIRVVPISTQNIDTVDFEPYHKFIGDLGRFLDPIKTRFYTRLEWVIPEPGTKTTFWSNLTFLLLTHGFFTDAIRDNPRVNTGCVVCGAVATAFCGGPCDSTPYCSRACQEADWETHRNECFE